MKKFFSLLAASLLCVGCAAQKADGQHNLVVYFSATGTTKAVAEQLADVMNADIWEIVPAETYTEADLDWRNKQSRSSLEMSNPDARPMIKMCTDIRPYDTIFIGYPIWWGVCPRIIDSWMENNLLDGKTLIPFATSGSSGIERSVDYLRSNYPDYNWQNGRLLNGATRADLETWKKELTK